MAFIPHHLPPGILIINLLRFKYLTLQPVGINVALLLGLKYAGFRYSVAEPSVMYSHDSSYKYSRY